MAQVRGPRPERSPSSHGGGPSACPWESPLPDVSPRGLCSWKLDPSAELSSPPSTAWVPEFLLSGEEGACLQLWASHPCLRLSFVSVPGGGDSPRACLSLDGGSGAGGDFPHVTHFQVLHLWTRPGRGGFSQGRPTADSPAPVMLAWGRVLGVPNRGGSCRKCPAS